MTLSELAKYSVTWSIARSLCDSWASCFMCSKTGMVHVATFKHFFAQVQWNKTRRKITMNLSGDIQFFFYVSLKIHNLCQLRASARWDGIQHVPLSIILCFLCTNCHGQLVSCTWSMAPLICDMNSSLAPCPAWNKIVWNMMYVLQ